MGKQVMLPMQAQVGLTQQRLALASSFGKDLQELFPGDPISDMFTPPDSVRASQATIPLLVRIQYPLLPVLVMLGGILAFVLGLLALGLAGTRATRYKVLADGVPRQVLLKPFNSVQIRDDNGREIGELKRGMGRPAVVRVAEGHTLSLA